MQKISVWITAARLRTLPLSIAGIILGNGLAWINGEFSTTIFILSILTTIAFQVLSNFANDYGDGVKGTDNEHRLGPQRVLQQGLLSRNSLKRGIQVTAGISFLFALALIAVAFDASQWGKALFFVLLGVASIVAAIKYTVGDSAYGYYALGDLFVFLFFGGVSVLGSYYLQTQQLPLDLLLPAASIGFFSTAVLNLNNLRDMENDRNSKKWTLPLLLGYQGGRIYHLTLILGGLLLTALYIGLNGVGSWSFLPFLLLLPLGRHLYRVQRSPGGKALDPELKIVALSTFFFALLLVIGLSLAQ